MNNQVEESDGSDIEGVEPAVGDFVVGGQGENVDPLDRAQEGGAEPEADFEFAALFDDNDDDEEFRGFQVHWVFNNFIVRALRRAYTLIAGATAQLPALISPLAFFMLIWGDDLWQHIANETNRCVHSGCCFDLHTL